MLHFNMPSKIIVRESCKAKLPVKLYEHIVCNHENNMPSRLPPQRLYGSSCTWAYDHMPKCMSCHKPLVLITGRADWFHYYIQTMLNLNLWNLGTQCVMDQV